jgi:hypothetical protein
MSHNQLLQALGLGGVPARRALEGLPLGHDPSTLEQSLQRWIQAIVYQNSVGLLLQKLRNPVSVVRSQRKAT